MPNQQLQQQRLQQPQQQRPEVYVHRGELRVGGSSGSDKISVDRDRNGDYLVSINGRQRRVPADLVKRGVHVKGRDGNDVISIGKNVQNAYVDGDRGTDIIANQADNAWLDGGDGHDRIVNTGNYARVRRSPDQVQDLSTPWKQAGQFGAMNQAPGWGVPNQNLAQPYGMQGYGAMQPQAYNPYNDLFGTSQYGLSPFTGVPGVPTFGGMPWNSMGMMGFGAVDPYFGLNGRPPSTTSRVLGAISSLMPASPIGQLLGAASLATF